MKLARAIHFDESDLRVYHSPARTGEWCISGGFEFSNWGEGDLVGKARQAFANGWLGVELLTVMRELSEAGVHESFSTIAPQGAELDLVAVHGSLDE